MKVKFNKGSIVRIYLENFLTFEKIELNPKNKFNLIIGANGSGKSTFMCAIVLGLGGKPSIIGRSSSAADYVKHGCNKAIIDLELYNPDGNNYIISRHITNTAQSTWYLQHKIVTLKRIEDLMAELNIQINNLCQILPQDRVQDFAKMNQKELLDNTQKAIGDSDMYECFHKLKTFRSTIIEREKNLIEKVKKYEDELQKNKRMEGDVRSVQEKQEILNKVSLINKKLQWLLYEEKGVIKKKMLENYKSAQHTYDKKKNDLQPLLKKIQDAEKAQVALHNRLKAETDSNNATNNKIKEFVRKHFQLKDKIESIKQELKSKLDAEEQKQNQITEIEKCIKNMEDFLPEMNEPSLLSSIKEADSQIDAILRKLANARESESEIRDKSMAINQSVRALEHKILQLNNSKQKKLEILANYPDVRRAYDWLEDNRDKFQGQVYGPMFMELNVKNSNHARYFEHIISWKDLVAFVCENPKDMSNLLRILRDGKKLKINAVTSTPLERSLAEMFRPKVQMSQLRALGFQSYLLDLIEGPDVILKFMCMSFGIHGIPCGTNKIENNLDNIPTELRAFFTENTFYRVSYSKYSGEKVQNVTNVGKSRFLSTSINQDLIKISNEELSRKQIEYQNVQKHLSEMSEMKNKFDVEINSLRNKKREFSRSLEQLKASNVRLRMKREELSQVMNSKIDPASEENKAKLQIEARLNEMVTSEASSVKVISDYSNALARIELLRLEHESARTLVKQREKDTRELEASVITARDEAERLKTECNQLQMELKAILIKARELCDGLDASDERFKKKYLPLFKELPENRTDLEEQLLETDAMAKCFQGNFDEKVLKEYEESNKLLRTLEKEVERLKLSASGIQEEAGDILNAWLPKVAALIFAINMSFGSFFAAMGCSGVVELDTGSDPAVYENYGLVIKVKFRNEGNLQVLDSHTQSGGERALTTAVYLLSLQSITNVPFRCVDEINQGMDEINEKRVYRLIMDTISSSDTAQYFLVTPTLHPKVVYPLETCVHCVNFTTDEETTSIEWSKKKFFSKIGLTVE